MTLTATLKDVNGNTLTNRAITWASSAEGTVSVNAQGVITGVAIGDAIVTATSEGKSAQSNVSVSQVPVARVSIENVNTILQLGGTAALTGITWDDRNERLLGRSITWSSNKPNVASVDPQSGLVMAKAGGQAIITAVSESKTAEVTLTVNVPVHTVQVVAAVDTIEAYDVLQLGAITRDANTNILTGRTITWTSSDPAVASIDANTGLLTGIDRGTVTLTATSEGKQGTAKLVVVIKYRSVTSGTMHACDIASGGIVWCWGLNGNEGRIGDAVLGANSFSSVPLQLPGNLRFAQIATFGRHTCGVTKQDAKLYCWGANSWYQLGSGTNISQSYTPVAVSTNQSFRKVAVGSDHSCGITVGNKLYCWGNNDWRQLGTGNNSVAQTPVAIAVPGDVADVEAGPGFTCAVTMFGKTYCWGANSIGQVGDGGQISYGNAFVALPSEVVGGLSMKQVDAGNQFACGLTQNGAAYCWGSNNGKFGNGPGNDSSSPKAVSGGINFASISTGYGHSCGVATNAELWCWGSNGNGQLGVALPNSTVPVRAANNMLASEVSAAGIGTGSGAHTCAISQDRLTVQCFGRNDVGQLGNGLTTTSTAVNSSPVIVVGQKPLPKN
jgi:alpha-tubulin suppressor-like RCC1 family protein/uncharacterized protein YjdB